MEILFITHKYPPAIGGMEKQSYELTTRMQQWARVHVLHYNDRGGKLLFFAGLKRRIKRYLRHNPGITILHFNDALAAAWCSGEDDFPGLIRTATVHGLDVVFPNTRFQHSILPRFKHFHALYAVSRATAAACIRRGIDSSKIHVIPNGVDHHLGDVVPDAGIAQKYRPIMAGKINLVMMGRPVKRKGFSWFLKSVLPTLPPQYQVLIIGPFREQPPWYNRMYKALPGHLRRQLELLLGLPTDEEALRNLLRLSPWQHRVHHLGKLPLAEMVQVLSAADAFLMPNIPVAGDMEGFGLVCLEANMCGLPVFAARLEGLCEAVHDGCNGTLLPPKAAHQWTQALLTIGRSPEATRDWGVRARQYTIAHFGWDRMAEAYYRHFQSLHDQFNLSFTPAIQFVINTQ